MYQAIYPKIIKSLSDKLFALLFLVVLLPLFFVISTALFLGRRPIIFAQQRPGLNGKLFVIYKFTSLDSEGKSFALGTVLRKSSLDELPQLFNIMMGEMSFIGPRPLLVEYLEYYTREQKNRHHVKPGITGLAQVNGRKALSLDDKVEFDLQYVNNQSLGLDFIILLKTFVQIVKWSESEEPSKDLNYATNES